MKHGETLCLPQDIAAQSAQRNMQSMHTKPSNRLATKPVSARTQLLLSMLAAILLGAGAAHAADTLETAVERPLDLSLPRDMPAKLGPLNKPGAGSGDRKAYGSGYEARRWSATGESVTSATEPASAAFSGANGVGLRGAATGSGARAAAGGNRGGGAGGRGRR